MKSSNFSLNFFFSLAKIQAIMARRFDSNLGGIGFSEFMILFYLNQAPDEKMRRIDLAEKIGLTASGVTRMLVPMEKIGLVQREKTEDDARVRYVTLAPGGKIKFEEGLERAELLATELIPAAKLKKLKEISPFLEELTGFVR